MAIRSSELHSSLMSPGLSFFNPKSGALTDHGLLWLKRLFFLAACAPALLMLVGGIRGQLGAEPVDAVTRVTGIWTLNFLMMTLAVTPLRYYLGWFWPLRLRGTFQAVASQRSFSMCRCSFRRAGTTSAPIWWWWSARNR